jgi:hypothetical protein
MMKYLVGRNRRPRLIQEVLDGHGMSAKGLSQSMGLSYTVVLETMRGLRNNRKVLRRLLELGAQAEYMDLPKDLLQERGGA